MNNAVSLQISLAPGDYPHARMILPHQLNVLKGQVNEIVLTVDTQPSKGRFADGWKENENRLYDFLYHEIQPFYDVKIYKVDYSKSMQRKIGEYFFSKKKLPAKDYRGGPFYAYFFGLFVAANQFVLHLDSDIFLGGASKTWLEEALFILNNHPDCLVTSPLPGPPHPEGILIGQTIKRKLGLNKYEFSGMSTRIFMIDKNEFSGKKISLQKPSMMNQVRAMVQGNPIVDLPEHLISNYMSKNGLLRVDFLGSGSGLWSLHPPYRCQAFYDSLPDIIQKIERNQLPAAQAGFYDIINEVCDWSEARLKIKNKGKIPSWLIR